MELIPLRSTTFGERMGQNFPKRENQKTRVHHALWADTLDQTSLVNVKMLTTKRDFTIKVFPEQGTQESGLTN